MYLVFDIGATKMRLAISRDGKILGSPIIVSTPEKFSDGLALLEKLARALCGVGQIKLAAGGIAGV